MRAEPTSAHARTYKNAQACPQGESRHTWKEEPEERADGRVAEELKACHAAPHILFFRMQRVQERTNDQILRPDHARGPGEIAAAEAREREARELRREDVALTVGWLLAACRTSTPGIDIQVQ